MQLYRRLLSCLAGLLALARLEAAEPPPKAPLPPDQAAAKMRLPGGFRATVFASEPDVRQPIAMTLDHRGRVWVAENFTYPNWLQSASEKDRIVILEDTDGDGHFDKRKVFWDQGQTVTGVAVGFGGVWVAATPNLLFIPDANGDDVPDGAPQVVLDGWDVKAQHNLFNALNWGPDGWLYGCNGILSNSRVGAPGTPDSERVAINCGVWRYHPTRKTFEAFAHGTTNPWGLDFDDLGELFITNCVIPHVFHVPPGARFDRMFGEDINPHTYARMPTCADHIHWSRSEAWSDIRSLGVSSTTDKAGGGHAHTGAMFYLGDNWPEKYRNTLFTCNIHGHRVNNDRLELRGSTYVARHDADFLQAADPWFRGMEMRYGPDGGVYLSDWSDVGECHDTDSDLAHRENGRIYKITYGTSKVVNVDLSKLDDLALAKLQTHSNDWYVRQARRLMQERSGARPLEGEARDELRRVYNDDPSVPHKLRVLWALHVTGSLRPDELVATLKHPSEHLRGWAVRLLVEGKKPDAAVLGEFARLSREDSSPRVRLALASALQRVEIGKRWEVAEGLVSYSNDAADPVLPLMDWYAIEPLAALDPVRASELASRSSIPQVRNFLARRIIQEPTGGKALVAMLARTESATTRREVLEGMAEALKGRKRVEAPEGWSNLFDRLLASTDAGVKKQATLLALNFGDAKAAELLRQAVNDPSVTVADRADAIQALAAKRAARLPADLIKLLDEPVLRGPALRALAAVGEPNTPAEIVKRLKTFTGTDRDDAIQTLASRPAFAHVLLDTVSAGELKPREIPVTVARQIQGFGDRTLSTKLESVWGTLRPTSKAKESLLASLRSQLLPEKLASADRSHGRRVFKDTCASCHRLFNDGGDLGPELTGSDRANLDYILNNVLDPSATVGNDFRLSTVATRDGRVLSGLIRSQNDRTVVVQTVNEKLTLDREDVEEIKTASTSVMPEGLFEKLSPEEIRDLVGYLGSPTQVPLSPAP